MKKKKAAAAAAVTVAAAAGMVTGAVFESPADLLPEMTAEQVQEMDGEDLSVAEECQRGPVAKVRNWVLGLPAAVRMLVAVPLWAVGTVLLSALSVFWVSAAPWAARLLGWISLAAVLLGVFAVSVKAAFPDVSFRRILRFRNVVFLVLASAVLCAADLALPAIWNGYDVVFRTVWRVGAACLLAFLCCAELRHQGKDAVKRADVVQNVERTAVELEARRLADSVCGKDFS